MSLAVLLSAISLLIVMPGGTLVREADGALTQIPPIVIEGNSGFSSNPRVTGGGTISNPYVISNYLIDCSTSTRAAIAIRNSTAFYLVKNVTIRASASSPAILTRALYYNNNYQAMNGRFENVTITGGSTQVYMDRPIRMVFTLCNFSNPSGTGTAIRLYGGYDNTFDRNKFNLPSSDIVLEGNSYMFHMSKCSGRFRDFSQNYFRYSDVSNNTLTSRAWSLYSGYSSDFQGNSLSATGSVVDLLSFYDSHRIKIANNTLQGGKYAIAISHPNTFGPVSTNYYQGGSYVIEHNRINGSNMGIYLLWLTGHTNINYLTAHHNWITNCTSYGFYNYYLGYVTNRIFRNLFEFNRGTGTTYSAGTSQAFDGYGPNSWSYQGVGNFWRDKTGPDDDSDGILDDKTYPLNGWVQTGKDPAPVSNRYFDFERPVVQLLGPKGRVFDAGYVNLSWTSYDNLSGMETVQLRLDEGPWANSSYEGSFGFKLTTGSHRLYLRAIDRAKLRTIKEVSVFVTSERSPVTIDSPVDGGYYNRTGLKVSWSLSEGFVPSGLTFRFDSGPIEERDPDVSFDMTAGEGFHTIELEFEDAFDNRFTETADFAVDLTTPELELLYPSDGVVIANPVVNFKWLVSDLTGIKGTDVRLDDKEWNTTDKDFYSVRVDEGDHTFKVKVTDMVGNQKEASIGFWVKANTSLHITSPLLELPTKDQTHRIEWEYLSDFVIGSLTATVDNEDPVALSVDEDHFDINLTKDGQHYVTIRALDPVRNEISDRIGIILDRAPPDVGFLSHKDGAFVNTDVVDLEWNALESFGLEGYSLFLDGKQLASGLKDRTRTVRMAEGVHDLGLEAYDRAGNVGKANITLTVDLKPPEVSLSPVEGNVLKERYHTFTWTVEDDWGVLGSFCSVDGGEMVDLGDSLSRDLMFDEEGQHRFVLMCLDLAGNNRTISVDFIVDTNDPMVGFIDAPGPFINEWSGIVRWNAQDSVGIKAMVLTIDGVDIPLSANTTFYVLDLDEGRHTINVSVTDLADRTVHRSVSFVLDETSPKVTKALEQAIVKGDRAKIAWILEEVSSGLTVEIIVDNQTYPRGPDLTLGEMDIGPLEVGNHIIEMVVTDLSGNRAVLRWDVTVTDSKEGGMSEGVEYWPVIVGSVLLVLLLIGSLVFFLRRRDRTKVAPRPISAPMRPDRIKVGGPTVRPAPTQAPPQAPPQTNRKGHVLDEGLGPSYYRPEKAHHRKAPRKRSEVEDQPPKEAPPFEPPSSAPSIEEFTEPVMETPPVEVKEEPERPAQGPPPSSEVDEIEEWGVAEFEEFGEMEELEEVEEWEE